MADGTTVVCCLRHTHTHTHTQARCSPLFMLPVARGLQGTITHAQPDRFCYKQLDKKASQLRPHTRCFRRRGGRSVRGPRRHLSTTCAALARPPSAGKRDLDSFQTGSRQTFVCAEVPQYTKSCVRVCLCKIDK